MQLLKTFNPENASETEMKTYPVREAARAVVVDADNNIALLSVSNIHFYKLPGGGVEEGEDRLTALQRECREEIGCEVEVTGEVGTIIEYRKYCTLKQISYCYLAKLKGDTCEPNFTEEELADGFEPVWLSYNEALARISQNQTDNLEAKSYIVPRDTLFLETAGKLL